MSSKHRRVLSGLALIGLATLAAEICRAEQSPTGGKDANAWSEESNGLQARLAVRYSHVFNGTGIIVTYLELQNVSEVGSPMLVTVDRQNMTFRMTDANGRDIPMSVNVSFSGPLFGPHELVLPHDSSIRFRIGPCGRGVTGDQAALIDLGVKFGWVIPREGKQHYLHAELKIPKQKEDRGEFRGIRWHGHLKMPPVLVPTKPVAVDPATVGQLINELGAKMLSNNGRESEAAVRELSLIDDPRVVAWYVKAVRTDSYGLRFSALDRLSRLEGDDALKGLEIGIATQGEDIGPTTRAKLSESLANNIRHAAVAGLARSPHPRAKELLFSMHQDPATSVRLTVIQAAAKMDTPESLALLETHTQDSDQTVRQEAARLLKLRNQKD